MEALHLQAGEDVVLTGFVNEEDLPVLYSAATVYVCPSLYEGFGMPVLEAMACGTPTVVSDRPALPEVTNGAAVLADPEDPVEFGQAILSLLEDSKSRAEFSQKGADRVRQFSWRRTVGETVAAYRSALTAA
jgi:glycosyltransferase involved in cell wall biosynthesis